MKRKNWVIGVFVFIWLIFSYPFFFQSKVPAPLDFLVNFYVPWDEQFDTPVKNPAIADVVNQIIPWRIFSAGELRAGRIPLWNPNNLAGTPHLGNWQTGVLYPTMGLFLFLPDATAWSWHILLQPLLAGLFMILMLRNYKLSDGAILVGAAAFAYGGFMTTWFEWGTLGHALLWLPLSMLCIDKIKNEKLKMKNLRKWQILLPVALAMSWLAGHPQTAVYVVLASSMYWLYRGWAGAKKIKLLIAVLLNCYIVPLLLAAPQVFPGIQVYLNSTRALVDGRSWAEAFLVPISGWLTLIAPDFFGNPVTRNSWSNFSYVEMSAYVGAVALILALTSRVKKYYWWLILLGLVLITRSPLSQGMIKLNLPVISSSSPARLGGLISFSLAVGGAFGLNQLIDGSKKFERRIMKVIGGVLVILGSMWVWTFVSGDLNILVARRNLIWPTSLLLITILGTIAVKIIWVRRSKYQARAMISALILLVVLVELFRFHHKFTPYSDRVLWYPEFPVVSQLKSRQGRSFGIFDANLNLPFEIESVEGYDPLISADYVRLTYSEEQIKNSNRITSPNLPKGKAETIKLINDLGVKWVAESTEHGGAEWELRLWEYPDQFKLDWRGENNQIFRNVLASEEESEPAGWMRLQQEWWFRMGLVVSGLTGLMLLGVGKLGEFLMRLKLPPDVYIRHSVIADQLQGKKDNTILDVGGSLGELKKFLPNSKITTVDVVGGDVIYDGKTLPFEDNDFEAVVSVDTIEHIPGKNRLALIEEMIRVASRKLVLVAPVASSIHVEYEKKLMAKIEREGRRVPNYLAEHVKYGLVDNILIDRLRKNYCVSQTRLLGSVWLDRINFSWHLFEVKIGIINRMLYSIKLGSNLAVNLAMPILIRLTNSKIASRILIVIEK